MASATANLYRRKSGLISTLLTLMLFWRANCACIRFMKSPASIFSPKPGRSNFRHEFVIGPPRDNPLFSRRGRLYYCYRCKWSFLVCDSEVVVVDDRGNPLTGAEGIRRFDTFAEGACPVFAALAPVPEKAALPQLRGVASSNEPATGNSTTTTRRPRPALRLISRFRHDIAGRRA
jgi:hypothetical protein